MLAWYCSFQKAGGKVCRDYSARLEYRSSVLNVVRTNRLPEVSGLYSGRFGLSMTGCNFS